jgi:hypothetical protein
MAKPNELVIITTFDGKRYITASINKGILPMVRKILS